MPQFDEPVECLDDDGRARIVLDGSGRGVFQSRELRTSLSPSGISIGPASNGAAIDLIEGVDVLGEGVDVNPVVSVSIGGPGTRSRVLMMDEDGNVSLRLNGQTGDVELLGADCAEEFAVDPAVEATPGMVMVIGDGARLRPCERAYDRRVAGVLSGARNVRPGIVLGRSVVRGALPLALSGLVHCQVDASYGSIQLGDLLTTSATLGHAMRVPEPLEAFGAVIGKAVESISSGKGLIPILAALQ